MTQEKFLEELRVFIARKYKTLAAASEAWECTPQLVSAVVNGRRTPSFIMLEDMGIERVIHSVTYRKVKK